MNTGQIGLTLASGPREFTPDDLQIAGLVPMSTVDWPGKFVASVFCQGCPWECAYCQNCAILDPRIPGVVAWDAVERLLARRHGLLDGVVFSGGEATRQLALIPAMRRVRDLGFAVGLHTAGAYPARLRTLLEEGLVDWVGLDIKALPENYPSVVARPGSGEKAWEALDILLDYADDARRGAHASRVVGDEAGTRAHVTPVVAGVDYEVRLTVYPGGPGDGLDVALALKERGVASFALQQARAQGTPDAFVAEQVGWDEQVLALADACEVLGFETFTRRLA